MRWNNYKDSARKFEKGVDCQEKYLYEHFLGPDHTCFIDVVSLT